MSNGVYKTRGPSFPQRDEFGNLMMNYEGKKYGVAVPGKRELNWTPEDIEILKTIKYVDLMNTYKNIYMHEKGHTPENPVFDIPPSGESEFGPQNIKEWVSAPVPKFLGEGDATYNTTRNATIKGKLLPPPELAEPDEYKLMSNEAKESLTSLDYINDLRKNKKLVMYEGDYLKPDKIPEYKEDVFGNLREQKYDPKYIAGVTSPAYKGPEWILDMANPEKNKDPIPQESLENILLGYGGPYNKDAPDSIFVSGHDLSSLPEARQKTINKKYPSLGNIPKADIALHEVGHLQKTVNGDGIEHSIEGSQNIWQDEMNRLINSALGLIK